MGNEWTTGIERARESDAHVAALLASALIARATHPCGTSAEVEASNAVNLYRYVVASLGNGGREPSEESGSLMVDSATMLMLGVSRDGVKYRYQTFLYDKLDDALSYARIDRERKFQTQSE